MSGENQSSISAQRVSDALAPQGGTVPGAGLIPLTSAGRDWVDWRCLPSGGENSDAAKAHLMPCFSCSVSRAPPPLVYPGTLPAFRSSDLIVGGFRAVQPISTDQYREHSFLKTAASIPQEGSSFPRTRYQVRVIQVAISGCSPQSPSSRLHLGSRPPRVPQSGVVLPDVTGQPILLAAFPLLASLPRISPPHTHRGGFGLQRYNPQLVVPQSQQRIFHF